MTIILGVSASVALYKACDIVRELTKAGHTVRVAMTRTAAAWINPVLFEALSAQKVITDDTASGMAHIEIRGGADLMLVAPATADLIARAAQGRADDIVTERKLIEDKGLYLETQARYQHIRERLANMGISTDDLKQGPHEKSHLYTLTAPIAGTVVIQNAVRGQGVGPGDELFELVDTSHVWVFANLPIEQARQFKEGDSGTITPKGGEAIVAPLTYLSPVADETTRTIRVRYEVANLQGQLKPREYVEVALGWSGPPVVTVPVTALTTIDKTRGLFLETAEGYTFVPVDTGREGGGVIEIRRGVKEGDRIVTDGVFDLKNVLLKEHIGSGE